jgi:hypothetical protein
MSHPYFNMSTNIANFLVPYLNNWDPVIRTSVFNYIKSLFRVDKRGEISYEVLLFLFALHHVVILEIIFFRLYGESMI